MSEIIIRPRSIEPEVLDKEVRTVGDLKKLLRDLPDDLEIVDKNFVSLEKIEKKFIHRYKSNRDEISNHHDKFCGHCDNECCFDPEEKLVITFEPKQYIHTFKPQLYFDTWPVIKDLFILDDKRKALDGKVPPKRKKVAKRERSTRGKRTSKR